MATFTITTAQNIDALTAKAGGDLYNVNGGILTIDQDSRVGTNQTTSTTLGTITLSASLGGTVNIDGTGIWMIPYTGGSGNVPAWNTTITNSSGSGKLIGVHSALTAASTATGAAMPATGFIRVKQKTGSYAAGALTGITATASDAGRVGWIELV
jgi:predicted RecA/RadA family phage recombinase